MTWRLHLGRCSFLGVLLTAPMAVKGDDGKAPPAAATAPYSVDRAVAAFRVDPGLTIELAAEEPDVVDPVEIAFDERGRMWVVEMSDYPNGPATGQEPRGRITILGDPDRDGRYDRVAVFAEGLLFANGLVPWKDGVIVTSAPEIAWLRDTDGDDRADRREVLFTGFTEGNPQLRVSHPSLGLDGRIHVANGLRGGKVRPVKGEGEAIDLGGMDFAFDLVTGRGEPESGMGQYGLTFDAWGRRFVCDNRHHLRYVAFPLAYARRNPLLPIPEVLDDISILDREAGPLSSGGKLYPISRNWTTSSLHAGRFTAACSVHIFEGDGLPAAYYGTALTCDPTGNLVHLERLQPKGASLEGRPGREGVEFLASPDSWFRPVNLASGPDGLLYVVDMCRAVIEHPEFMPPELKERPDLRLGDDRGRIWRIRPTTAAGPAPQPDLGRAAPPELARWLGHPNRWHRETAYRRLRERNDPADREILESVARKATRPLARVQAAYLLKAIAALDDQVVASLLGADGAPVREHAVRLAEARLAENASLRARVEELAGDPDAHVRFQAALTLGSCDGSGALDALARIAEVDAADRWTRLAVASAAPERATPIATRLLASDRFRAQDVGARDAMLRLLAGVVGARGEAVEIAELLEGVAARSPGDDALDAPAIAVLSGLSEGLARKGTRLGAFLDRAGADQASRRIGRELLARACRVAEEASRPLNERREAVLLMANRPWDEVSSTLPALLENEPSQEIRTAAVAALAAHPEDAVAGHLLRPWGTYTPAVRRAAADALLRTEARAGCLLEAVAAEEVRPGDLEAPQIKRLLESPWPKVKARAAELLATGPTAERREVLARYREALGRPGDAARGRAIFQAQCATCHRVAGIGSDVGPDIGDTRTRSRDDLLTNILAPNQAIDGNYVAYVIATRDGNVFEGIIQAETTSSLTLRRSEGRTEVLLRQDIEEMRSTGASLMPEGLERQIGIPEMADLLTFLKDWRYLEGDVPASISTNPGVTSP